MAESRRFKVLAEGDMSAEQRAVFQSIASGPRGGVRGPFNALLRSPELAQHAQKLGEYVRFGSSLPEPLKELAILVTARYWSAQYEWYAHAKLAAKAGVRPTIIESISKNEKPMNLSPDEALVYEFCMELHYTKVVTDHTYDAVENRFGERGVVDLIGTCGYYTLVSMVLNVERHPIPDGQPNPLRKR